MLQSKQRLGSHIFRRCTFKMKKNVKSLGRALVESLYLDNPKQVKTAITKLMAKERGEDLIIIILHEAVSNGNLTTDSKALITISDTIIECRPKRELLIKISDMLKDPAVFREDGLPIDFMLAENFGFTIEEWPEAWSNNSSVITVKKMFAQAPYSTAIDERCDI